ncbi:platelet glycoprotein VI-like [Macrochelys suwanniensis]
MASALTVLFLKIPAPGPSIFISPSGVIVLGGAVTIRCQCRCGARRLFLYKDGVQIWDLDAGDGGEFTIPSARQEDAGFYNCRSHSRSELPNWSDPRDYLRIVVAELSYPKPSISLRPRGGVALGRTVTIRCKCRCQKVTFLMYKLGNPDVRRWAETSGDVVEFPIHNVSRRDTGNYSCQYSTKSDPSIWSHPSDPVELMVAGGIDPTQPGALLALTHPGSATPSTGAGGRKSPSIPPETDYTQSNIFRLALSTGILLALALILAEAAHGWRRGGS